MGVDEELFDDMMSTSEADRERVNTLLAAEAPMKNISVIFYVALDEASAPPEPEQPAEGEGAVNAVKVSTGARPRALCGAG